MFEFSAYHVTLLAVGAIIIIAYWLPRFVSGREPAASALLIGLGYAAVSLTATTASINPVAVPGPWQFASELCVVIGLFGVGLRIDRLITRDQWRPAARLLFVAMPLSIGVVSLAGWAFGGMTFAGALILASALAPTDPVLAGDVQVGPPSEGGEHQVRFALTTEAGLNDGLAFPFVYLAIAIAAAGVIDGDLLWTWLWRDVAYRSVAGVAMGYALGWLLGKILFDWPSGNALAKTDSAVVAFVGVLMVYGATELVEGYGFLAVFVTGLTLRRSESRHSFHTKLHDFSQTIEHVLTSLILVALGAAIPSLLPYLTVEGVAIGLGLIFLMRPLTGWLALSGVIARSRERAVVAFYGIRGIGSVYYVAYATAHIDMIDKGALWATVVFTILVSTIVHGFSAGIAVEKAIGEPATGKR